jgi:hypothetical protein
VAGLFRAFACLAREFNAFGKITVQKTDDRPVEIQSTLYPEIREILQQSRRCVMMPLSLN